LIVARAARKRIIAIQAMEDVVPFSPFDAIVAVTAVNLVGASATQHQIVIGAAVEQVVAGASFDAVVFAPTIQGIVTSAAHEQIDAAISVQGVGRRSPAERIVAVPAKCRGREHRIVAENVVPVPAGEGDVRHPRGSKVSLRKSAARLEKYADRAGSNLRDDDGVGLMITRNLEPAVIWPQDDLTDRQQAPFL
jgi:hypothetical protein